MRVVFCTTPLENANTIAKTLVVDRLAACVNIVPKVSSYYYWKNELCNDEESMLIIKTKKEVMPKLINKINEIHPYDTVEIVSFEIKEGDPKYLKWISNTSKAD